MAFFGAIADFFERIFERFDRVNFRAAKRVALALLFVLCAAAAWLYAVGKWDLTFIERPERKPVAVVDNTDVKPSDADDPADTDEPADTAEPSDTDEGGGEEPPETPKERQPSAIAMMSDLCADGWYVTSGDYDPTLHRIAVMNYAIGTPTQYTLRQRNVYAPSYEYEYEYGEAKVVYNLVAEDRPTLEAYGGYLFVDIASDIIVFDSYGNYVTGFDGSLYFAGTRDKNGAPLLYSPATRNIYNKDESRYVTVDTKNYYALTPNGIVASDYVDEVYSRGVHADLPASYGAQTEPYARSVVVNTAAKLDLKGTLTGWVRTLWGFTAPGGEEPYTVGWYDPEKLAEEAKKAEESRLEEESRLAEESRIAEESRKAAGETEPAETEAPVKEPKPTAKERFEAAKAAAEQWDRTPTVAFNYSEGYACVANEKGQMWFIDRDGKELFETRDLHKYNAVGRPVVENLLMPLTNGIESLGFYYFDHGLVRVRRQSYDEDQEKTYHMKRPEYDDDELIYATGEKFTLAEGYDIISYSNGMILLEKNGKYGFMDYTGAWIVQPDLDGAKPFVEGLAPICRGGKWGVVDTAGDVVIPLDYDYVQTTSSGVIVCHYAGGWTVFAKMGQAG